ncbi:MAG: hypothetical protein QM783_11435 [Phycisphaerales bacterium]
MLHIADMPGAGWDALAAAARCADECNAHQRLLLIGDRTAVADAATFGLAPTRTAAPPLRRLDAAVGALDRAVEELHRQSPVDVIHVWSDSARVICRETFAYRFPLTQEDPGPFVTPRHFSASREALRTSSASRPTRSPSSWRPTAPVSATRAASPASSASSTSPTSPLSASLPRISDNYRAPLAFFAASSARGTSSPSLRLRTRCCVPPTSSFTIRATRSLPTAAPASPPAAAQAAAAMGLPIFATDSPVVRRLLAPLGTQAIAANGLLPELARVAMPLCESTALRREAGDRLRAHAPTIAASPATLNDRWHSAVLAEAVA